MKKYFIILGLVCFLQACDKQPTDMVVNSVTKQEIAQPSETIPSPTSAPSDEETVLLDPTSITLPIDWETVEKSNNGEVFDYIIDNFCEDENYNPPPKGSQLLDPCSNYSVCSRNWRKLPPLAEAGDAEAQNKLAHIYYDNYNQDCVNELYDGSDPKHDPRKALDLFRKSAEQGNVDSMSMLGLMYLEGPSFYDYPEQDSKEAEKWFLKAALKGDAFSSLNLARLYTEELGLPKDPQKARKWANQALQQKPDDPSPNYYLGLLALDEKQYKKAAKFFEACEERTWTTSECQYADYELSKLYEQGLGVEKNLDKAVELYNSARPSGEVAPLSPNEDIKTIELKRLWYNAIYRKNPLAQYELGRRYEKGDGVEQNRAHAAEWYSRAAEQNNPDALYALVKIDVGDPEGLQHFCDIDWIPEKKDMLEKAAQLGQADAAYELGKMYKEGAYVVGGGITSNGCLGRGWRYNDVVIGRDAQKAKYYLEKSGMAPEGK